MTTESNDNIFLQGTRLALRFESDNGLLSIEDVWQLPLKSRTANRASLNSIAVALNKQLRDAEDEVNFVDDATPSKTAKQEKLRLSFEIVKQIIAIRKEEDAKREAAAERAKKRQRIMQLIEDAEDAELKGKGKDELQALLQAL